MFKIPARDRFWDINTPQIMGILNATQDSFFEASRVNLVDAAVEKAGHFIKNGASIIDIGGQSTRPGATFISCDDEIQNVVPIIEAIHAQYPSILISIDTFQSKVAVAALHAGAHIVNDISCGGFDSEILKVVAKQNAGFIGMHLTGDKNSMHQVPNRENIVTDILQYFELKKKELSMMGISNWVIDPGFGFGKTIPENFELVKSLKKLTTLGLPILLGVSRKSSIYKTLEIDANDALNGTTVVNTVGLLNGANILRVHDIKEAYQITQLLPFLS
jgi:dihydropteroate synthase